MDARKFDIMTMEAEFAFDQMLESFEQQWEGDRAQWQQTDTSSEAEIPGRQLQEGSALTPQAFSPNETMELPDLPQD